ncbi:hypothetical protein BJV74DRAFT_64710 [Russula compacta]|nr:hypothetical protein BJV74DRAFT_64710 [Russula compacta]
MLRNSQPETAPSRLEIASPCLLLLHELSSYFLDGETSGSHSLASYLSLVAHALTMLRSWSEQATRPPVSLVLMDSRLDRLSLPVLKPPSQAPTEAQLGGHNDPPYRVAFLIHHYFEWQGTFESEEASPSSFTYSLRLRETVRGDDDGAEVVLRWNRMNGERRVFNDRPGVIFTFMR